MAAKKNFQIDRRVGIALDALSATQRAAVAPILRTKEGFVAHSKAPGATRKLSSSEPLYSMKAGSGMRIIFTERDEGIVVQDIMRKATMDHLGTHRIGKSLAEKRAHGAKSAKQQGAVKNHKS